jgi:hypothetical protein
MQRNIPGGREQDSSAKLTEKMNKIEKRKNKDLKNYAEEYSRGEGTRFKKAEIYIYNKNKRKTKKQETS